MFVITVHDIVGLVLLGLAALLGLILGALHLHSVVERKVEAFKAKWKARKAFPDRRTQETTDGQR